MSYNQTFDFIRVNLSHENCDVEHKHVLRSDDLLFTWKTTNSSVLRL